MLQSKTPWVALIGLYVVQGLPHGFFGQAMPVLLREQGLDLAVIGLLSLLSLPWALKFVWAPWLDRFSLVGGEFRRSWILCMNAAAVVLLLVMSAQPLSGWTANLVLFAGLLMLLNTLIATQDIATDALAVENLPPVQRGVGNGIQVAGYRIGMILAGGLLVSLYGVLGWQLSLCLLAALMALGTVPLWFFRPRPHVVDEQPVWPLWLGFFRLRYAGWWLLLLLTYKFGDAFGTPMIRPMLSDAGLTLQQLGVLLGTAGFLAGLAGALAGGWLVGVLGRQTALLGFLVLEALALLSYLGLAGMPQPDWLHIYLAVTLEHIAGGMGTAAIFTVMMDRCREHCAAGDYAVQSCLIIVAGMVAGALSGFSARWLGYDAHFALAALLCVLALPVVWALIRRGGLPARVSGSAPIS